MSDDKVAGKEKVCGACKEDLICVEIVDTYQNRNTKKLQWQTKSTRKAHFKFAGPGKWNCIVPSPEDKVAASMPQPEPEPTPEPIPKVDTTIKVTNPFQEAELIARWSGEKAYKIVMAEVTDFSKLTPQEKSGLGQKEGMYTRLLADTVIELMKINGMKSQYGN